METILSANEELDRQISSGSRDSVRLSGIDYITAGMSRKVSMGYLTLYKSYPGLGSSNFGNTGVSFPIQNQTGLYSDRGTALSLTIVKPTISGSPQYLDGYGLLPVQEIRQVIGGKVIQRWNPYSIFLRMQLMDVNVRSVWKNLLGLGIGNSALTTAIGSNQTTYIPIHSPFDTLPNTILSDRLKQAVSFEVDYASSTGMYYLNSGSLTVAPSISSASMHFNHTKLNSAELNALKNRFPDSQVIIGTVYEHQSQIIPASTTNVSAPLSFNGAVSDILFMCHDTQTQPVANFTGLEVSEYSLSLNGRDFPEGKYTNPALIQAYSAEYNKNSADTNVYEISVSMEDFNESVCVQKSYAYLGNITSKYLNFTLSVNTATTKRVDILAVCIVMIVIAPNGDVTMSPVAVRS